jgi:hypothetical protein
MFVKNVAAGGAFGLWALSSMPTAYAALSWSVCEKNEAGEQVCKHRIPRGARLAMAVCCLVVLILLLTLVVCICKNRRNAKEAEKEYDVEASQRDGPPTIIATEYNPSSGPAGVYSGGPRSATPPNAPDYSRPGTPQVMAPQMTGPAVPVAVYHYDYNARPPSQIYTAPLSQQYTFSDQQQQGYPFAYNANYASAPKTASMTQGFPRPLLAGSRLKDKIKERPASISSLSSYTVTDHPPSK